MLSNKTNTELGEWDFSVPAMLCSARLLWGFFLFRFVLFYWDFCGLETIALPQLRCPFDKEPDLRPLRRPADQSAVTLGVFQARTLVAAPWSGAVSVSG